MDRHGSSAQAEPKTAYNLRILALAAILLAALLAAALLAMPLKLPIGPMYWDNFLYVDAASRISFGQVPSVDFFTPAGPLGYYLAALVLWLFPSGQSVLAANWSLLIVSLPLMALIAWEVGKRSPGLALALTLPFLFYALLPFNTSSYYPFPGADGFAIYNRHGSQLIYLAAAALIFVRTPRVAALVIGLTMAALFAVKITAFLAAGLLCLLALVSGRVHWRTAAMAIVVFAVPLAVAELLNGVVSAYVESIVTLVQMNEESLTPRLLQGASRTFGAVLAASLLALTIFLAELPRLRKKFKENGALAGLRATLDHPAAWLAASVAANIFYESQNTGSQEFIFVWPAVLMTVLRLPHHFTRPARLAAIAILAGCVVLPPIVATTQFAARAFVGMVKDEPLQARHLGRLGAVVAGTEVRRNMEERRTFYIAHRDVLVEMADADILPSFLLYSDFDFQLLWLKNVDEAADALIRLEAEGMRYDTVFNVDFTNPFGYVLGKQSPLHVAIGADPTRAVPDPDDKVLKALSETDIVLVPLCPYTAAIQNLSAIYAPALTGHRRMALTPCYDMLVRPGIEVPGR